MPDTYPLTATACGTFVFLRNASKSPFFIVVTTMPYVLAGGPSSFAAPGKTAIKSDPTLRI